MGILNTKVIPQFASMFSRFGIELPWPTPSSDPGTSNFFVHYWPVMIGVSFAIWLGIRLGAIRRKGLKSGITGDTNANTGSIVNRACDGAFCAYVFTDDPCWVPLNQAIAQMAAESLGNRF